MTREKKGADIFGDYDGNVVCPRCGNDYNHINAVFTRTGSGYYEAEQRPYLGTVGIGKLPQEDRGCLVVVFECENGCGFWELRLQQHKGMVYGSAVGRPRKHPLAERVLRNQQPPIQPPALSKPK